jgi:hypothetical protein
MQVPCNANRPPSQIYRLLLTFKRYAGISLFGRVEFPKGFCVGEGADMVHVTPDTMRILVSLVEKTEPKTESKKKT